MTCSPAFALRASVAVLTALALAACSPAAPTETGAAVAPSASPAPSTGAPTPEPTSSAADPIAHAFESQDGAVRFLLPEGWSVDDRSAMGEASEMYNHEPGWLNDLVLLDETGAQMLWYREYYGDDSVVCADREWQLEVPIEPYGPALAGEELAPVVIVGSAGPATDFRADGTPGAGAARMRLQSVRTGECPGFDESIWLGDRVASVDAVSDEPGPEMPEPVIEFADEQAASAWLQGEEAAELIDVLSSMELTGAPMLDEAP